MNQTYDRLLPFKTLFKKEVLRFLSVATQTLFAPIVSASLYLLIFGVSLGSHINLSPHYTYVQFVIPGLILMGVINNSFANSSSSLFMSRYLGNIVEFLVTPLDAYSYVWAYTLAAMFRGFLVGLITWIVTLFFTGLPWANPLAAIAMLALASFIFSQFGILAALYSASFDTLSMFTNFLILPLIYLGGLFYPASSLPEPWSHISRFNPMYFLIGGFRQAVLGSGDVSLPYAFLFCLIVGLTLHICNLRIFQSGRKLRS